MKQHTMNPHPRQEEADAIGVSLEDLLDLEQNRNDQAKAELLGIEAWEVRMRRLGATDSAIDAHREKLRQEIKNIIGD
jgi:hypothetical protein